MAANNTASHPPVKIDISYAMITLGSAVTWSVIAGWLMYFYLPPGGSPRVPVALYSLALLFTSIVNALVTPPLGYLSDQTRSRWGRRLPYMFASALPLLVFFVLLWTPPTPGESPINLIYLTIVLVLYKISYVANQVPHSALLPEIALTDEHRVRMSAWGSSFMLLGMIGSSAFGPLIEKLGYALSALGYAILLLPFFYLPFLVLRERPAAPLSPSERLTFWQSLALTARNRAFQILVATGVLYWCVSAFVYSSVPYLVTEICLRPEADTMYFYFIAIISSLVCYPIVAWLANKYGRWQVFMGSLLASAIVMPGMAFIGEWLPIPLLAQGLAWIVLESIVFSGVVMLPSTFDAEITDYDAMLTGQRREGAYYSAWGLLDEVVNGMAMTLLPLVMLLGRSRSDPYGPLGVRMVGIIGSVMLIAAFAIFLRYPLRHGLPKAETVTTSTSA